MKGAKNTTNPEDLIDFMIVAGDNIYAADPLNPTDEEFDQVLSLFQLEHLKNLKAYAIRGNHDCEFAWDREIKLSEKYSNWYFPSLYYKNEFDIGGGKKFGLMNIDSCLLLCSTYSNEDDTYTYPPVVDPYLVCDD